MGYSDIIAPVDYNRMMSVHRYISASDRGICEVLAQFAADRNIHVLEVGCGPGRITPMLASVADVTLTGVDVDERFISYARSVIAAQSIQNIELVCTDVMDFQSDLPFDAVVSQGFHHHVPKARVHDLLQRIHALIRPGGLYVVGDEFLPAYTTEYHRRERAVVWYSHIIAHAIRDGHRDLAVEEAKTLLDDLQVPLKSQMQIDAVLSAVERLSVVTRQGQWIEVSQRAEALLAQIQGSVARVPSGDLAIDLSRGDYKVDHSRFTAEVESAGFHVTGMRSYGPVLTIGGMCVYVLKRH